MGFVTLLRDERLVVTGIAVASVTMLLMMKSILTNVVEDNLVEPVQPKTQYITQETEDSLQLETLDKLVGHPSYSVREVSIKILSDRAVNDLELMDFLLRGITQRDYDHRMRCLRALALLMRQNIGMLANIRFTLSHIRQEPHLTGSSQTV
jgi:isocitrate/isopropylmalate dehydrogenase